MNRTMSSYIDLKSLRGIIKNASGRTRTCYHQIRSLVLYPGELRTPKAQNNRVDDGSRTRDDKIHNLVLYP